MIVLKHKKGGGKCFEKERDITCPAAGTATDLTQQTEESDADSRRVVDCVALLSGALVDADLLDMWTDISAPIPVAERPAGCTWTPLVPF